MRGDKTLKAFLIERSDPSGTVVKPAHPVWDSQHFRLEFWHGRGGYVNAHDYQEWNYQGIQMLDIQIYSSALVGRADSVMPQPFVSSCRRNWCETKCLAGISYRLWDRSWVVYHHLLLWLNSPTHISQHHYNTVSLQPNMSLHKKATFAAPVPCPWSLVID